MLSRNEFHTTKLHEAALTGNATEVNNILKQARNHWMLTQADKNGELPLDRAAPRGHDKVVEILIHFHKTLGIPYEIKNANGYHPLLAAAKWWLKVSTEVTEADLRVGKFNIKEAHIAYPKIITLLVNNYEKITKTSLSATSYDKSSSNALYYTVKLMTLSKDNPTLFPKAKEMTQLLLNCGLSLNVHTDSQLDARTIAKQHNISALIGSLEEKAKKVQQQAREEQAAKPPEKKPAVQSNSKTQKAAGSALVKPAKNKPTLNIIPSLVSNPFSILSPKTTDLQSPPAMPEIVKSVSLDIKPKPEKNYAFTRKFLNKRLNQLKDFNICHNKEEVVKKLESMFKDKLFTASEQQERLEIIKEHIQLKYQSAPICCWEKRKVTCSLDLESLEARLAEVDSQKPAPGV